MNLTLTIITQFAFTSATLSRLVSANPTNPPTPPFDWFTFFWGGALGAFTGALIILSIERVLDWIISSRKYKEEREQAASAMKAELQSNIQIATDILEGYNANAGKIFPYHHHFSTTWLELYRSKFIDFTKKTDHAIYEQLDWFCKQMGAIEDQRKNVQLFDAITQVTPLESQQQALHNHFGISNYNTGIAVMTNELREKLKNFVEQKGIYPTK